jgi:hypothetical protein
MYLGYLPRIRRTRETSLDEPSPRSRQGTQGQVLWLSMQKVSAREICSKNLETKAGVILLAASLAFLVGCQGFSSGNPSDQQQGSVLSTNNSTRAFGAVSAGSSKTLTVNVQNSGPNAVTISSAAITSQYFSLTAPSLPATVASGQSSTISVMFSPNAAGTFNATLSITSNASNSVTTITLTGSSSSSSSSPGELTLNPTSETFPSVAVGAQQSATVTLTNVGGSSVDISQASVTGTGFQLSGISTPLTLAASQSTTFTVTFAPEATGSASGTVTIASNASNPSLTMDLSGTGIAVSVGQLNITPATLGIGNVVVGTSGHASGSLSASGASVTVTTAGTSNSAFTISGLSLPVTIAAGQSVPFTITFSPTATGAASATLSVASNAQTSASTETVTGTGTAAPTYSVNLSWDPSSSSDISGYNIYRAVYTTSCGSFAKVNSSLNTTTQYTDTVIVDGTNYCYATTAVNTNDEESSYSNVVSNVQIPSP